jgi:hypothetical protein
MSTTTRPLFFTALCLVALLGFAMNSYAGWHKTYTNPKRGGYRVDWCHTWAKGCGKKAADTFCSLNKKGAFALGFERAHNIGATTPTKTIGSNQVCNKSFCDGFQSISCVQGYKEIVNFPNPTWHGKRLDWCLGWNKACGRAAAQEFCYRHAKLSQFGSKVAGYWKDHNIGATTPTKTIGTNQVCNKSFCDGFTGIVCKKH